MFFNIGYMAGAPFGGVVFHALGFPAPFWMTGSLLLVLGVGASLLLRDTVHEQEADVVSKAVLF